MAEHKDSFTFLFRLGGFFLVALLIFHAGVAVGARRHPPGRMGSPGAHVRGAGFDIPVPRGFIPEGHGTVGSIESIDSDADSLVVRLRDGSLRTVHMGNSPLIRTETGDASSTALKTGQFVVILGVPDDDGAISARLIRVRGNRIHNASSTL